MLTNVELDHHSTYASELEVRTAFDEFLASVQPGGAVVAWEERRRRRPACSSASRRRRALRARDVRPAGTGMRFTLVVDGEDVAEVTLPVPGEHNVLNALAAIGAVRAAGRDPARAALALASFQPAGRRFEPKGEAGGVRVFDDYAHHADRGRGHARGGARARAAAPRGRLPAAPVLAHRAHPRRPRPRARGRGRGRGAGRLPGARAPGGLPGRERRAGRARGGRPRGRARGVVAARRTTRWRPCSLARLQEGDLVVTLGAGDVDAVGDGTARRASSASHEHAARARAARLSAGAPHDDPHRRQRRAGSPGRAGTSELQGLLAWARQEGLDVGVVGSGSNLLVADLGFAGLVLKLDGSLAAIEHEANRLLCGGGARLPQAAARAAALGPRGHRVRRQHPRHGRRRGADERQRLRRRAEPRARVGRRLHRRGSRPPRARAARLRLSPLEPGPGRDRRARVVRARSRRIPRR